eukprot:289837_1
MALIIVIFLLFIATNSQICPNQGRVCNGEGECCSKWGYCGIGQPYCDDPYDFGNEDEQDEQEEPTEELQQEEQEPQAPDGCPLCICESNEEEPQQPQPPNSSPIQPSEPFEENCNCICYGDPHCKMWNCAINNWQGPHKSDPMDVYYMTRCNGYSISDMPFDIIGVNQGYDEYFTSLDYTILKLYAADGLEYCIRNKGSDG